MIVNERNRMPHEVAIELLPWLVSESLQSEEREAVLDHANSCVICRRETKELENLRESVQRVISPVPIPAPDMRNINARIDQLIDRRDLGRRLLAGIIEFFASPWRALFAAQSILLLVFATVLFLPTSPEGEFTTLTQSSDLADGHYLRVVFSPDLTHANLGVLLGELELAIVDGPSDRGVYTLTTAAANTVAARDEALAALSSNPDVLFAQPVDQGARQ